jgi:hypothetical protein
MSSGKYCLIRDLGLVKGGKGLRHHEVVLQLSARGIFQFVKRLAVQQISGDEGSVAPNGERSIAPSRGA